MTEKTAQKPLAERLAGFIGRKGATLVSPDPVNAAMIRQWCVALGDEAASDYAASGTAPAAMLQVWTMPGWKPTPTGPDAVAELFALLDAEGYSSIVATDSEQDYLRPLKLGETIAATKTIASISDEKKTGLGTGFFVTTHIDIVDSKGESVGRQLHRVLKFRPPAQAVAAPAPATASAARRPRPNVTRDIAFYFEAAHRHQLLVQQCKACGSLQHPPWPSCAKCGSFDMGHRQMSGRGEVYTFTIVHSPVVAPFKPPYNVVLVKLEEGVNIVSELRGVEHQDIRIGMKVEVDFVDVDAGMVLPVFRTASGREKLPPLILPLDRSTIVATALATRDYQPVHHDPDYARRGGSKDTFMNILTSQGLVGRYVTQWAGAGAVLKRTAIRLGASNYPGDTMVLQGEVLSRKPFAGGGEEVEVAVRGSNSLGDHVKGTAVVVLPARGNQP